LLSGRVGFEGVVCASPFVSTLKPPDDMTYFFSSLVPLLSTLTGPCFASPGALFDFNGGGVAPAGGLFLLPSVTFTGFFPLPCRSSLVCADVHAISAMARRMMVVHFDISLPQTLTLSNFVRRFHQESGSQPLAELCIRLRMQSVATPPVIIPKSSYKHPWHGPPGVTDASRNHCKRHTRLKNEAVGDLRSPDRRLDRERVGTATQGGKAQASEAKHGQCERQQKGKTWPKVVHTGLGPLSLALVHRRVHRRRARHPHH
jgi:hypothetical protein